MHPSGNAFTKVYCELTLTRCIFLFFFASSCSTRRGMERVDVLRGGRPGGERVRAREKERARANEPGRVRESERARERESERARERKGERASFIGRCTSTTGREKNLRAPSSAQHTH